MVQLYKPANFIELYAFCKDDEKPKFPVENWIKRKRVFARLDNHSLDVAWKRGAGSRKRD